jgi:hypothetical protein
MAYRLRIGDVGVERERGLGAVAQIDSGLTAKVRQRPGWVTFLLRQCDMPQHSSGYQTISQAESLALALK